MPYIHGIPLSEPYFLRKDKELLGCGELFSDVVGDGWGTLSANCLGVTFFLAHYIDIDFHYSSK